MPRGRFVVRSTGAAAIDIDHTCQDNLVLKQVTVHFSSAPSTSENFTMIKDATGGAAYDTTIYSTDPSADSATDIVFTECIEFLQNDILKIDFANTDTRTYGVEIIFAQAD